MVLTYEHLGRRVARHPLRVLVALALVGLLWPAGAPSPAAAQPAPLPPAPLQPAPLQPGAPPAPPPPGLPPLATPMGPRDPLPPPTNIRNFPSPPEALAREIGVEEAVGIALQNQPQILARLGDYQASLQRIDQAFSAMLPQLVSFGTVLGDRVVQRTYFSSGAFSSGAFGSGSPLGNSSTSDSNSIVPLGRLSVSQRLFDFGKTYAATDVARFQAESFREDVESNKDVIVLAVKESYINMLFAQRLVAVNEAALDRANLNLRSAQGFYDVGTRPRSDVTRAEVDVANARVDVIRAQNAVSLARTALNTAMGVAINILTRPRDILAYERFLVDRDRLVTEALSRRPEYRQIKAVADAAEANVRQTFRDFFPELFAVGSVGGSINDFVRSNGNVDRINNWNWEAGLELRWNIYDGGNKIARYKESQATFDAAKARVRDVELTVWQAVENAHVNLGESEERIFAAQKAVESAEENFRLSQGRFDAGVGTIIELTDAQLALTRAQSTEAQALADYRIAIARLERALGRR
ncbi:MAG: TolC family protein [Candidatus Rokubacteria bacterium]|nr:TolC family protein [Candidatus Rokubacteria bacterium]